MTETERRVIRTLGSGRIHVADVHPDQFKIAKWIKPFVAVDLPSAVLCGVVLRSSDGVAVCMEGGTKVTCPGCRRLAATERAAEGNELLHGKTGAELWEAA